MDTYPNGRIITQWWKEPKTKVHEAVFPLVQYLEQEHEHRANNNLLYYSLFSGAEYTGLGANRYSRRKMSGDRLKLNIIHAMISTVMSKITKNKGRVIHLTEGGDYSARARGQKLTKITNGAFAQMKFHRVNAEAWRDACVFDLGAVKFYKRDGKVCCERVFPNEFRIDETEAVHGDPRSLHQVKPVSREVLIGLFPDKASSIRQAARSQNQSNVRWVGDMVDVCESWHLPSAKDAKDGKHCITIENETLICEGYERDYFPFVFHRWDTLPLGFHGQGLSEQLVGIQHSINKVLQAISEHFDLGVGYIAIETGSNVNPDVLAINEIARFIEFQGAPPQWITPDPISPMFLSWLELQYAKAFEIAGISQLSATGKKPAGLNSGAAQREYQEIETERFAEKVQRYEESFVTASKIILDMYEDIYSDRGELKIPSQGRNELETIDWEAARMDRDSYTTKIMSSSFLPATPGGKLEKVVEMMQAGMIGREEGMMLLDYPDLEKINELNNAALRNIDRKVERMLEPEWDEDERGDQYLPPEPFDNHALAMRRVTAAYQAATLDGAPEENLELLRRYLIETQDAIEAAQAPAQAPPMPGPGPGAAMPMPPPDAMMAGAMPQ